MTKAAENKSDPFLALLDWRNTPSEQLGSSPAQLMFGQRTRTRLPTADELLTTPASHDASTALQQAKDKQAANYNVSAKDKPPFKPNLGRPYASS